MCIKKRWGFKLYIDKKDGTKNENNNRESSHNGLYRLCLRLLPIASLLCSKNMQREKCRNIMHNISIIARLFFTKPQTRHCAYRRKGDYSRARLTDDEDARSCMNYSRASWNRHPRTIDGPRDSGSHKLSSFRLSFRKEKQISCCMWRPVKKRISF